MMSESIPFTRGMWAALAISMWAVGLHSADALIVTTMLPAIVTEMGGTHLMHLSVGLYEMGSVIGAATSALVLDRLKAHVAIAASALLFGLGCGLSFVAPDFVTFVLSRLIQGVGGGVLLGLTFVVLRTCFPEEKQSKAMALVTAVWGVSALTGPMIGGLSVELASWRLPFAIFALLAACLASVALQFNGLAKMVEADQSADAETAGIGHLLVKFGLLFLAVGALVFASITHAGTRTLLSILGVTGLLIFLAHDRRDGVAWVLPKGTLQDPTLKLICIVWLLAIGSIAINVYLPFFLVALMGLSELQAGYIFAIEAVIWTGAAALVSRFDVSFDQKAIGLGITSIFVSALALVFGVYLVSVWVCVAGAILQGLGFGLAWGPLLRRTCDLAPFAEQTRAAAAIPLVQRMGFVIGTLFLGSIAQIVGIETFAIQTNPPLIAAYIFSASLVPLVLAMVIYGHLRNDVQAKTI